MKVKQQDYWRKKIVFKIIFYSVNEYIVSCGVCDESTTDNYEAAKYAIEHSSYVKALWSVNADILTLSAGKIFKFTDVHHIACINYTLNLQFIRFVKDFYTHAYAYTHTFCIPLLLFCISVILYTGFWSHLS